MGRDLSGLDPLAILIDGIEPAEHTVVAALGADADGRKHPLGLGESSTESPRSVRPCSTTWPSEGATPSVRCWR